MHPTVKRKDEVLQTYRIPAVPEPDFPEPESVADPHFLAYQAGRRARRVRKVQQAVAGALFFLVLVIHFLQETRP